MYHDLLSEAYPNLPNPSEADQLLAVETCKRTKVSHTSCCHENISDHVTNL